MHLHLVRFQFVKRFFIDAVQWDTNGNTRASGTDYGSHHTPIIGWKDTIMVPPGDGVTTYQVTTIRAQFQRHGRLSRITATSLTTRTIP